MLLHGGHRFGQNRRDTCSAMQAVLAKGRSAILPVLRSPKSRLITRNGFADLHQIFGDEVAILHSALE